MKIQILLKPNAKHEKIEKINPQQFRVSVKAPAREGKANQALSKLLSQYLAVPQNSMVICLGFHSKNKIIEIL